MIFIYVCILNICVCFKVKLRMKGNKKNICFFSNFDYIVCIIFFFLERYYKSYFFFLFYYLCLGFWIYILDMLKMEFFVVK